MKSYGLAVVAGTLAIEGDSTSALSGSFTGSFSGSAVDAFYASGAFSGSFEGDGTNITGVTAEWDGTHTGNATITGDLTVDNLITAGNVDGRDVSVDGTKLDTVEENADVTDTANVTAAGAVMDSEVTSLSGIKSLTVPDSTTISSFGASLVDDADATAAKTTLGLENVTNESKATMFASPTFTGIPIAPTPSNGDDSTKVATTAFVMQEVTDLIGGAGPAFDTLIELSASLANGDSDVVALTAEVATKATKANNLSDLTNAATARTNLGLGSIATLNSVDISSNTNLAASTGITLTGDTLTTNDGQIVHDNLSGFVANEHINHANVSITAGNGLTGGGTIAATRTLNIGAGTGITVNADDIAIGQAVGTSDSVQFNSIGVNTAPSGVAGAILATNDVVAFASSDERLKENLEPIGSAVEKVEQLTGYTYNWIPMEGVHVYGDMKDVGVIAQEVEKVLPELVSDRENGYKAVKYDKLTAVLIQAVKELSERVKTLEGYHS